MADLLARGELKTAPRMVVHMAVEDDSLSAALHQELHRRGHVRACSELATDCSTEAVVALIQVDATGGLASLAARGRERPNELVLALLPATDRDAQLATLQAGAVGVRALRTPAPSLFDHLEAISRGVTMLPIHLVKTMFSAGAPATLSLTVEERELLKQVAAGSTMSQIARQQLVSERTLYRRWQHLLRKLGAGSRAEALMLAGGAFTRTG